MQLQQKAFPYTTGFTNVGNAQISDGNGNFAFVVALLTVNTQFRVVTVDKPKVTSPVVIVGCAVRVGVKASHTRVKRGRRVRFSGHVTPLNDGALYAIQRLRKGAWVNVAGGSLRHGSASSSRYAQDRSHPARRPVPRLRRRQQPEHVGHQPLAADARARVASKA